MTYASSRQVFAQAEIIKTYNKSRHVFEARLKGKPGVILYTWAWQRWGELDPSFRQADVIVFKTGIGEPRERQKITEFIGPYYTRVLWQIWDKINRGINSAKSRSVADIVSLNPSKGVGIYRSRYVTGYIPVMARHDDYFGEDGKIKPEIEQAAIANGGIVPADILERIERNSSDDPLHQSDDDDGEAQGEAGASPEGGSPDGGGDGTMDIKVTSEDGSEVRLPEPPPEEIAEDSAPKKKFPDEPDLITLARAKGDRWEKYISAWDVRHEHPDWTGRQIAKCLKTSSSNVLHWLKIVEDLLEGRRKL